MIRKNKDTTSLLTVTQAAKFLNVHSGTIRRWAYANYLKGTKVGMRGDWRFREEDVEKMAMLNNSSDISDVTELLTTLPTDWTNLDNGSHYVHFYEKDTFLLDSITKYIEAGDAAIVIATSSHRTLLEKEIQNNKSKTQKNLIFLDAAETLEKFMVHESPDEDLFNAVVGGLIKKVSGEYNTIRAYGEMVALLWAKGNKTGAIELEELWNKLQKKYPFALYCAYPMRDIGGNESSDAFSSVCTTHSNVLPTEKYTSLDSDEDRLREIAKLQQKAQALETEILEHQKTEIKLLQVVETLKASEDFNRRVIENSADCIKILDLQGNLVKMNQPGCNAFEIDNIEVYLGKDYRSFWKDEYYKDAVRAIETARNGSTGRFQGFCPTAKGTPKWWDVVVSPIYGNNGKIDRLLAISRDITSIKELEQRKEDFLSATSHELKTPLTSQKAFIQLLQQETEQLNNPKYNYYINKVEEQSDKLTNLVKDLLDASKVQGGKLILNKVKFDLSDCIENAVEEVQTITIRHKLLLKGKMQKKIYGDKDKISQVIINLLTNAIKYSPNADKVNVVLKEYKNFVKVSVQDYGIGIDQKDQKHIFERFYRVSGSNEKTYPGLGMGLYIVSEIIKQHNGEINVESTKGKGSVFSFILPFK